MPFNPEKLQPQNKAIEEARNRQEIEEATTNLEKFEIKRLVGKMKEAESRGDYRTSESIRKRMEKISGKS